MFFLQCFDIIFNLPKHCRDSAESFSAGPPSLPDCFHNLAKVRNEHWYNTIWRRQWHPLQSSCLENPMDRGTWQATVHGVTESRTPLRDWLHFHFSLSCIGEGNSNPLQCSCLENPRDGGAWWAAVYGVAQSRTRLTQQQQQQQLTFLIFICLLIHLRFLWPSISCFQSVTFCYHLAYTW